VCTVDLVFVVDTSYLFSPSSWNYMLNFTASIVQLMSVAPTATQVGFVKYGFTGTDVFILNRYTTTSQVVNAILSIPFAGDWSNEQAGIQQIYTSSFLPINGNRTYAPDVAVVISGLAHNQGGDPSVAAQIAMTYGIQVLSVGIMDNGGGGGASASDVINIASSPKVQNVTYWNVPNFASLYRYVGQVYNSICPAQVSFTAVNGKLLSE
jgi:hypothetical protein